MFVRKPSSYCTLDLGNSSANRESRIFLAGGYSNDISEFTELLPSSVVSASAYSICRTVVVVCTSVLKLSYLYCTVQRRKLSTCSMTSLTSVVSRVLTTSENCMKPEPDFYSGPGYSADADKMEPCLIVDK